MKSGPGIQKGPGTYIPGYRKGPGHTSRDIERARDIHPGLCVFIILFSDRCPLRLLPSGASGPYRHPAF